ncbi:energy-coupling factor transporter transmembrane component T [Candidatus Phytoplasma phoenicium]|uniref:ABC-type cobalt transport system, permease component n=1 Tax=Candidatus Phytoplasma phoenicium TaxID=198422 RepID=A0A0L0MJD9_9MOLU|nr:energy-coupling factor transporter transmembrane component T [Candidatus Phytoplasma phoenicium]KND62762.1 ABC-type cobalt transport system, permease component [Candidatus Phytoplasma phoenicium]
MIELNHEYKIKKHFLFCINPALKIIFFMFMFKIIFSLNMVSPQQDFNLFFGFYFLIIVGFLIGCMLSLNFSFFHLLQHISYLKFVIILSLIINLTTIPPSSEKFLQFKTWDISLFSFFIILLFFFIITNYFGFKKIRLVLFLFLFLFLPFLLTQFAIEGMIFTTTPLYLSHQCIFRLVLICIRIWLFIILNILMAQTTSFMEINDGLEILLKPLKKIKLPVEMFCLLISLIFMSIPFLLETTQKILKAQMARGINFYTKNIRKRIYYLLSILIPIFVLSLKKSFILANAMETRGYVLGKPRTKLISYCLTITDYVCGVVMLFLFVVSFYM